MSIFSTNQVRQLYVAKAKQSSALSAKGDIIVSGDKGAEQAAADYGYFIYRGAGGDTRSDIIRKKNIVSAIAKKGSAMGYNLRKTKITLDSSVNSGNVISGQDYLLKLVFRGFIGVSDEDQYIKHAVVHGYAGMTASDFYKKMACSLFSNLSREVVPLVNVYLVTTAGGTDTYTKIESVKVSATGEYTPYNSGSAITGTFTALGIEEAEQPWKLGTFPQRRAYYDILPDQVLVSGNYAIWATLTEVTSGLTAVGNGKIMADMEYFYMGERGDQYRNVGFPNVLPTEYMVNSSNTYSVIEIQYYADGNAEDVQKSPKMITIAVPDGSGASVYTVINSIINVVETVFGVTIADLS